MASLKELVDEIMLEATPNISDDTVLDERLIKHWIHKQRALWLRNEMNKVHRTIDYGITQQLILSLTAASDITDLINLSEGKELLKSTSSIPKIIEIHNGNALLSVTPIWDDNSELSKSRYTKPLSIINYLTANYMGNGKFTTNKAFTYLHNSILYVVRKEEDSFYDDFTSVRVIGVFENPEDVSGFSELDEYPLSIYMWNYIKDAIIKSDLRSFYISLEDVNNNAANDLTRARSNEGQD